MSSNRMNKRKKYFSTNLMVKKRPDLCLQSGLKGFISTTNGQEKQCIRESYNILNEYADKIYGDENKVEPNQESKDEEKDIMDDFESEVASLKAEGSKSNGRRFQAINTGIFNCIFIKTNLNDPVGLMDHIVKDLSETKEVKTRFLIRMVPVEVTCKAYIDDIKVAFKPLLEKYFKAEPTTFCVTFNRRHNSNLDRDIVIKELAELVSNQNEKHKVNLTSPTCTIIIEVMKGICGLAVVRDYFQYSKYNLNSICGIDPATNVKDQPSNAEPTRVKQDDVAGVSSSSGTASNEEKIQEPESNSAEEDSSSGAVKAPQSTTKTVPQIEEKNSLESGSEDANCKSEPAPKVVTSA